MYGKHLEFFIPVLGTSLIIVKLEALINYKRGMAACWEIKRPKRRLTWVWHMLDLNLKGDHSPTQYNGVNV